MSVFKRTAAALTVISSLLLGLTAPSNAQQRIEIPSSFNPVGSGARAIGMGGAFIAIADDATAASWNPGGLAQLERSEVSLVMSAQRRIEDNTFGNQSEASGDQAITIADINYFSVAVPFKIKGYRAAALSISYQRLYDMHRDWTFDLNTREPTLTLDQSVGYSQKGTLSAVGLAYSTEINSAVSAGVTFNIWDSGLNPNHWEQESIQTGIGVSGTSPIIFRSRNINRFELSGYNLNLGFRWQITNTPHHGVTIGAVFKSGFTAEVERKNAFETLVQFPNDPTEDQINSDSTSADLELEFPAAYGVGLAWRYGRRFVWALDFYRTQWDDFILTDDQGERSSAISGRPLAQSNISPTIQIRTGIQYILDAVNYRSNEIIIPIRAGLFYDQAPAEENSDDFYGLSIGTGASIRRSGRMWMSIDLAYQYRMGRDVGQSILQHFDFSQDIDEHSVYVSLIHYL